MASHQLQPQHPHFFKIILHDCLRDGKLGVPRKFARKYVGDLPNFVHLMLPNGLEWKVELIKHGVDEIFLEKGWQEFVDYYSLEHGYFLVFEYDRNQHFHVLIFDKTATEIDYPFVFGNGNKKPDTESIFKEPKIEETEDDNVSIEALDDLSPYQKRKIKSPLECPLPCKKMRSNSMEKQGRASGSRTSVLCSDTQSCRKERESVIKTRNSKCCAVEAKRGNGDKARQKPRLNAAIERMPSLKPDQKAQALCRASNTFKFRNPVCMVVMQPSYICPGNMMRIPASFSNKYLKKKCGNAILCVLGGRTWSVQYSKGSRIGSAHFYHGWRKFAQDNDLLVGDVCAFELIEDTEILLNVVISRGATVTNHHMVSGDDSGIKDVKDPQCDGRQHIQRAVRSRGLRNVEVTNKVTMIPPFFKTVIRLYHFKRCCVGIPVKFMSQYIKESSESIMLLVADRWWPVKLCRYQDRRQAMLSTGWGEFARENSIQVGDVCVFEATENDATQLKVSISRANTRQSVHEQDSSKKHIRQRPSDSRDTADNVSPKYTPIHPFYKVVIHRSHLISDMHVPKYFVSLMKESTEYAKVQVQSRCWYVKLIRYPRCGKLSAGWINFARENVLKMGDVCVFELIRCDDTVLNVSIIRKVG